MPFPLMLMLLSEYPGIIAFTADRTCACSLAGNDVVSASPVSSPDVLVFDRNFDIWSTTLEGWIDGGIQAKAVQRQLASFDFIMFVS